jgi:uncharacterized protein YidB (DUF937 family)
MGLMDVLTGMNNGPRGGGSLGADGRGGMSPIIVAALGLLAYKAVKGIGAPQQPASQPPTAPARSSGSLGDILGSLGLGGARGSTGAGGLEGVLSGGLGDLVRQFQAAGRGDVANTLFPPGRTSRSNRRTSRRC